MLNQKQTKISSEKLSNAIICIVKTLKHTFIKFVLHILSNSSDMTKVFHLAQFD